MKKLILIFVPFISLAVNAANEVELQEIKDRVYDTQLGEEIIVQVIKANEEYILNVYYVSLVLLKRIKRA